MVIKQTTNNKIMLIDKYNRILIDKLPKDVAAELKQIADDTENFSDDELVEIYKDNFNDIFAIIETKHPEALKPKKKLIKKTAKKKIVKPAKVKKRLVKKKPYKAKLVKKADDNVYLSKVIILWQEGPADKAVANKEYKSLKAVQNQLLKTFEPSDSVYNKNKIEFYFEDGTKVVDRIDTSNSSNDYNPSKQDLSEYMENKKSVMYSNDRKSAKSKYVWEFKSENKKAKDLDCDDAIETLEEIEKKKAAAVKKRAEAPKKKASTAAEEKQVKTISSVFKTTKFKQDKEYAKDFAKDLVAVYKKYGLNTIADKLEKDIKELIETKYKVDKMESGGRLKGEGIDLFDDYDSIPTNVQKILDKHSKAFEDGDYDGLAKAKEELEKIGYTFEYYVDGSAYDLRKIGQKGKSELDQMEMGGKLKDNSAYSTTKEKMKGLSQEERIDAIIKAIQKHKWSSKKIEKDSGMVRVYSKMYDLEPTRVASLFNKYQKK